MNYTKFIPIPDTKPLLGNSVNIGPALPDEKIQVTLRIRGNPASGSMTEFLEDLGEQLPRNKKHFTREELEILHGSSQEDFIKIKKFASDFNLEIEDINLPHRLIDMRGLISNFNTAFGIKLGIFSYGIQKFRSHIGDINIPENLNGIVEAVFGLDQEIFILGEPRNNLIKIDHRDKIDHTIVSRKQRYSPRLVSKAYNMSREATGKGQSIGIIQLGGGYKIEDIEYYLTEIEKVPMPKITEICLSGARNNPGIDFMHDMESILDLEIIGSIAYNANLNVYFAPNTELGLISGLIAAIFDRQNRNNIITFSWGLPEKLWRKSTMRVINSLFKAAGLLGITVCVPSGNKGANNGIEDGNLHVDFPASSPYVLSCGGTKLYLEDDIIANEVAWKERNPNDGELWSTGGGVSSFFEQPAYQIKANIIADRENPKIKNGRCVPDVAAIAGTPGYNTYINKKPTMIGGGATSAAAPLWAAVIALINEKIQAPAGFINPLIYKEAINGYGFNDITTGDNVMSEVGGYNAHKGWNACTGWGSPNGEKLLKIFEGIGI